MEGYGIALAGPELLHKSRTFDCLVMWSVLSTGQAGDETGFITDCRETTRDHDRRKQSFGRGRGRESQRGRIEMERLETGGSMPYEIFCVTCKKKGA